MRDDLETGDLREDNEVIHIRDTVNDSWSMAEARTHALLKLSTAQPSVRRAVLSVWLPGQRSLTDFHLDRDEGEAVITGLILGMSLSREARRMPVTK